MKFFTIALLLATASAIQLKLNEDPKPEGKDLEPQPSKEAGKKKKDAEKEEAPLPNMGRAQDVAHQENDKIVVATTTTQEETMKKYNDMHEAAMDKYTAEAKEQRRSVSAHRGLVSNQDPHQETRAGYPSGQPEKEESKEEVNGGKKPAAAPAKEE